MALAPYFDKTALAAATVLAGFDRDSFAAVLERQVVGIVFDDRAATTTEGRTALELLVNLFARLYPKIALVASGPYAREHTELLTRIATGINPVIEITGDPDTVTICAVLGDASAKLVAPAIHVGSDGWIVRVSRKTPVGFGASNNPFGAAAAACFAAANVFRVIFTDQLPRGEFDEDLAMSIFDLDPTAEQPPNPSLASVELRDACLVGIGAIGNGALWVLARVPWIGGVFDIVDGERVDLTNVQRYVLTTPDDVGRWKVEVGNRELSKHGSRLVVRTHPATWGRHLAESTPKWSLDVAAVALDSARDRIAVQAALPRRVINAWTQAGDLGISRHDFLADNACLACLYLPNGTNRNDDDLVAEAIGLPGEKNLVRDLLHSGAPVGEELVLRIAEALGVAAEPLLAYADRPLRAFYSEVLCGGVVLRLQGGGNRIGTEVPMVFQSALAGVLLAAALVREATDLPSPAGTKSVIDLLRPLGTHLSIRIGKHPSGQCICQDRDYRATYAARHAGAVEILSTAGAH